IGELIPPGARFPLDMARDADVGSNSVLTYQLTSNPSFSLALRENPGGKKQPELVLERALDREKQSSFELVLMAVDGGDPARSGTVQVRINVTDANDNPPVFSKRIYEARVAENLPVGSLVLQVLATDADAGSNGKVSYSFDNIPDNVAMLFSIDSESGEIRKAGPLDFEENSKYTFDLEARDGGGFTDKCEVLIGITDVNDNPPEITIFAYVAENNAAGALVLRVQARDADAGANGRVSYWLAGGSAGAAGAAPLVSVEARSGALYAQRSLDYEQCREFAVEVRAQDGGSPARSSTATVRVFVLDRNDNAPRVLWPAAGPGEAPGAASAPAPFEVVPRSAEAGYLVAKVVAVDADAGRNAWLSYE
ncbi:PCDGH protein, partial [Malurus elegans]|nr:PCDGH protein [Malurus elegans]